MTTSTITFQNIPVIGKYRKPHRMWWQYTLQIIFYFLLCIVFLESYFRLAGVGGQEFVRPNVKMGCEHIPGKQVIWRLEGYSDDKLSSVGLRDSEHKIAKEAGTYRIVLLGDSAVESLQVGLDDTFGKMLELLLNEQLNYRLHAQQMNTNSSDSNMNARGIDAKLSTTTSELAIKHFEVINFGCSSYSTGQEVLQYEQEVNKYQPDAIVLLYNRGDSLENVVHDKDRRRVELRPYFYLDQANQLQQDNSLLIANIDKLKPQSIKDFLREHSAIYGILGQADFSLTLNEPRYSKVKNWLGAIWNAPGKIMGQRKNKMQESSAYPDQDDMAVTKALLERLANNAAAHKQKFVLMVFPNIVHYDILAKQAKELKILAEKNHFLYLDLTPSFLAQKDPGNNFIQYHFSKKGHCLVAYELLKVIKQNM